jgi:hypothetical protein
MSPSITVLRKHSTDNNDALELYLGQSMGVFAPDHMVAGTHYVELPDPPNCEAKFFDNKRMSGYLHTLTNFAKDGTEIGESDVAVYRKEMLVKSCEWYTK